MVVYVFKVDLFVLFMSRKLKILNIFQKNKNKQILVNLYQIKTLNIYCHAKIFSIFCKKAYLKIIEIC